MAWGDEVERAAPDEDVNTALAAIRRITASDRVPDWQNRKTDYEIVVNAFGEAAHIRCGRALRTLQKRGAIEWRASGQIRLAATNPDPPAVIAERLRLVAPPEDIDWDTGEIHGPFGRRREEPEPDEPRTVAAVLVPTSVPVAPQDIQTVHAPLLAAEPPPEPAQEPPVNLLRDATKAVLDRIMDDTEPF